MFSVEIVTFMINVLKLIVYRLVTKETHSDVYGFVTVLRKIYD